MDCTVRVVLYGEIVLSVAVAYAMIDSDSVHEESRDICKQHCAFLARDAFVT